MIRSIALAFLFLAAPMATAAPEIMTGLYKLSGTTESGKAYAGKLTIQPEGANYRVRWFIGDNQSQTGIGMVENGVLSIGYRDDSGEDQGVVTMRVNGKTIKGKWASLYSTGKFGTEEYTFDSEKIPAALQAQPAKK